MFPSFVPCKLAKTILQEKSIYYSLKQSLKIVLTSIPQISQFKFFFLLFIIYIPPEFQPVLGPCTHYTVMCIHTAIRFRRGSVLGLYPDMIRGLCQLGSSSRFCMLLCTLKNKPIKSLSLKFVIVITIFSCFFFIIKSIPNQK